MPIAQTMLPEFDNEMATTRRLLERVPEQDANWAPHTKSMTLGQLSQHLAELPRYGRVALAGPEVDLAGHHGPPEFESTAAALQAFDQNVRAAREAIEHASDEQMREPWTLRRGTQVIFTMPRVAALRVLLMNHMIHHRGQLSVYLRLRDVPLPSIYGPSADTPI